MVKIQVKVNGTWRDDEVEARLLLVHYLREVAGLTGTHIGCETSDGGCGAPNRPPVLRGLRQTTEPNSRVSVCRRPV